MDGELQSIPSQPAEAGAVATWPSGVIDERYRVRGRHAVPALVTSYSKATPSGSFSSNQTERPLGREDLQFFTLRSDSGTAMRLRCSDRLQELLELMLPHPSHS
jgi:hypothetical protein